MNTGGPAFPIHGNGMFGEPVTLKQGMSLLDYMAGQIMVGVITGAPLASEHHHWYAKECYDLAAAMLAEKARRESKSDSGVRTAQSDDGATVEYVIADSSTGKRMAKLEALNRELAEALKALLARDQRNTCQHKETRRGGVQWEICDQCGAQWADDEGGKPFWLDPPEWIAAEAVLAKAKEVA